jgi:hypothetical protein
MINGLDKLDMQEDCDNLSCTNQNLSRDNAAFTSVLSKF